MKTKTPIDLAALIRSELAARNMTIADLADKLGVRRSCLDRALAGTQDMTVGRLSRWADAMGARLEIKLW